LGAFQLTFGFSSSEFYLEFEDFLNLPIEGLKDWVAIISLDT
jgi:hypothetical protein|tara:strand:- start:297 stop:422 length:126 start_codon:yes stop_codon:yes gene_type:complete